MVDYDKLDFTALFKDVRKVYNDSVVTHLAYSGAYIGKEDREKVHEYLKVQFPDSDVELDLLDMFIPSDSRDTAFVNNPPQIFPDIIELTDKVIFDGYLEIIGMSIASPELYDELKTYKGNDEALLAQEHVVKAKKKFGNDEWKSTYIRVTQDVLSGTKYGYPKYFIGTGTNIGAALFVPDKVKEVLKKNNVMLDDEGSITIIKDNQTREFIEAEMDRKT